MVSKTQFVHNDSNRHEPTEGIIKQYSLNRNKLVRSLEVLTSHLQFSSCNFSGNAISCSITIQAVSSYLISTSSAHHPSVHQQSSQHPFNQPPSCPLVPPSPSAHHPRSLSLAPSSLLYRGRSVRRACSRGSVCDACSPWGRQH